jgi:hypothetical protein
MARLVHLVHGVRREIVQRDDAHYQGRERRRNLRVAHVGDVLCAFDVKLMDFRVKGFSHLPGRAGKIDHHAAAINDVDFEMVAFQPVSDAVQVSIGWAESFAEFVRADPAMEIWRSLFLKILEEFLKLFLFLRRPLKLQQHVLQEEVIVHGPAIIRGHGFGTNIAMQLDELSFIDILRYQGTRVAAGNGLRFGSAKRKTASKDTDGD